MWAITDGVPPFWEYAMEEGCTVDAAAIQVSVGNVSLIPARWGE